MNYTRKYLKDKKLKENINIGSLVEENQPSIVEARTDYLNVTFAIKRVKVVNKFIYFYGKDDSSVVIYTKDIMNTKGNWGSKFTIIYKTGHTIDLFW